MGKIYNNLISTTTGFNYAAQQPLDDREVVQSYADLSDLVASNVSYDGMEVYVVDDKKSYKLIDGSWKAIATEGYVDQKVGINLENGEANGSLIQKDFVYEGEDIQFSDGTRGTQSGDVILGAVATGFGATAFGGLKYDYYTSPESHNYNLTVDEEATEHWGRTPTSAEGNQSFAAGGSVHAHGDWSSAFNKDTNAYQKGSASFGGGTQSGMSEEEFNKLYSIEINGVLYPKYISKYNYDPAFPYIWEYTSYTISDGIVTMIYNWGENITYSDITNIIIVENRQGLPYEKSWGFGFTSGEVNTAKGRASFAANYSNDADGMFAAAFNEDNKATGQAAFVTGKAGIASGNMSFKAGEGGEAAGTRSAVFGYNSKAIAEADNAFAAGYEAKSNGFASVAMGYRPTASGSYAVAVGENVNASGNSSFATNSQSTASGNMSSAFGGSTQAKHLGSSTFGERTVSARDWQTVVGRNNKSENDANALFVVGNGTDYQYAGTHSTALRVNTDGTMENMTIKSTDQWGNIRNVTALKTTTDGRVIAGEDAINDNELVRKGQLNRWLSDGVKLFTGEVGDYNPYTQQGTLIGNTVRVANNTEEQLNGYSSMEWQGLYTTIGSASTTYKAGVIQNYTSENMNTVNLTLPTSEGTLALTSDISSSLTNYATQEMLTDISDNLASYKQEVLNTYATQQMVSLLETDTTKALADYKKEVKDGYATQEMLTNLETETSKALTDYKQEVTDTYATKEWTDNKFEDLNIKKSVELSIVTSSDNTTETFLGGSSTGVDKYYYDAFGCKHRFDITFPELTADLIADRKVEIFLDYGMCTVKLLDKWGVFSGVRAQTGHILYVDPTYGICEAYICTDSAGKLTIYTTDNYNIMFTIGRTVDIKVYY